MLNFRNLLVLESIKKSNYNSRSNVIFRFARTKVQYKMPIPSTERRLDIAIIGTPNVGKSVILNQLIKYKVAATSRKKHTTRSEILGVFNYRNIQLAFYDTPGFVRSADALRKEIRTLRSIATSSLATADVIMIVVDASYDLTMKFQDTFAEMVRVALSYAKIEIILVLNKVDLVSPKSKLLELTHQLVSLINGIKLGPERAHEAALDTTTFMISALHNDGVVDLKNYLLSLAPSRPWVLPKEAGITDLTKEERVEEVILEKLLENTHDEIPYVAEVRCVSITDINDGNKLKVDVDIIVENSGQQRIVVGQQGRTLVKIRQASSEVLEKMIGKQVMLYLWIKIRDERENR